MPRTFQASSKVDYSRAGGRAVLFHQETGKATILNPTGTLLWAHLSEPVTEEVLGEALRSAFPKLDEPTARADAGRFLESLLESGLVAEVDHPPVP